MTWKRCSLVAKVKVSRCPPSRPYPRLMAISHRLSTGEEGFTPWLRALAEAGVDCLQLREKHLDDRSLFELARQARRFLPSRVRLLVNGRLDIALAAGADGVHLPADGPPTDALRKRFGEGVILGRSTHSVEEIVRETRHGANFVTFGPIFPTPSKPGHHAVPGLAGLVQATQVGVPVLALGGVDGSHFEAVSHAGAAGVAAIRLFQEESKLPHLVRQAQALFVSSPVEGS